MPQMRTEYDIIQRIADDQWIMDLLRVVRTQELPDWWIAAGCVRGKIWDDLHGYAQRTPIVDIDVIYFDPVHTQETEEHKREQLLYTKISVPWSVTNQARMHAENGDRMYTSSADAMSFWPEIVTCIGVRLEEDDTLSLCAPFGITDLIQLQVRPNPQCTRNPELYRERMREKQWHKRWPRLRIHEAIA